MREELLTIIENNCRIGLKDLAVMLGTTEETILNEMKHWKKKE